MLYNIKILAESLVRESNVEENDGPEAARCLLGAEVLFKILARKFRGLLGAVEYRSKAIDAGVGAGLLCDIKDKAPESSARAVLGLAKVAAERGEKVRASQLFEAAGLLFENAGEDWLDKAESAFNYAIDVGSGKLSPREIAGRYI